MASQQAKDGINSGMLLSDGISNSFSLSVLRHVICTTHDRRISANNTARTISGIIQPWESEYSDFIDENFAKLIDSRGLLKRFTEQIYSAEPKTSLFLLGSESRIGTDEGWNKFMGSICRVWQGQLCPVQSRNDF